MRQELSAIASKIGELEMEKEEHQLVLDTLSPLGQNRTCFRLMGGVLVERTIEQVAPMVESNLQGVK
jgi:prefoldin subunit 2